MKFLAEEPSTFVADSLTHATAQGTWFGTSHDASLSTLISQLDASGIDRACLTGAPGQDDPWEVLDLATMDSRLTPVPCLNPRRAISDPFLRDRLLAISALKLHPRFNDHGLDDPDVSRLISLYSTLSPNPRVFICTYLFGRRPLTRDPVSSLHAIASRYPDVQFLFLHAAGHSFLQLLQAVYPLPNVLVDFSYTIKEAKSAGTMEQLRFALQRYQSKVVWGSDFPEVSVEEALSNAYEALEGSPDFVAKGFLGANLATFMGWDSHESG